MVTMEIKKKNTPIEEEEEEEEEKESINENIHERKKDTNRLNVKPLVCRENIVARKCTDKCIHLCSYAHTNAHTNPNTQTKLQVHKCKCINKTKKKMNALIHMPTYKCTSASAQTNANAHTDEQHTQKVQT